MSGTGSRSFLRVTPEASALVLLGAGGWVVVIWLAQGMRTMAGTLWVGVAGFLAVWSLMTVAMMLPSVAPVAALYARSFTERRPRRLLVFASGYLLVWIASGLPALGAAWVFGRLVGTNPLAIRATACIVCLGVAAYQVTPVKRRCLTHCRSPLSLLLHYAAYRGRFRELGVGVHHGAYCLACCWPLMILLVALGTMNLAAMVFVAGFVLLEKYPPRGWPVSWIGATVAAGFAVLVLALPQITPALPIM